MTMTLQQAWAWIAALVPQARLVGDGALPLARVHTDTRTLQPGDLFVAWPGAQADGRRYIADAIARGACAVLWERGGDFVWNDAWRVPQLSVSGLRLLCGPLAHAVLGQPTERLSLIAVTGTNGKTTITQWLSRTHPQSCAVIGTLGSGSHWSCLPPARRYRFK